MTNTKPLSGTASLLGRYCALHDAAAFLDVPTDRLVHLGAIRALTICVMPDPTWEYQYFDYPGFGFNDPEGRKNAETSAHIATMDQEGREQFGARKEAKWMTLVDRDELLLPVDWTYLRALERGDDPELLFCICQIPGDDGCRIYVCQEGRPRRLSQCRLFAISADVRALLTQDAGAAGLDKKPQEQKATRVTKLKDSTLLKLVLGMACRGYGYDPQQTKSSAIPEIVKDMEELGLSIGQDTIRTALKDAVDTHGIPGKS